VNAWQVALPALLAFAGVALAIAFALRRARRLLPLDRPNERSLHATPTPRIGGMAMMAVLLPVALATLPGSISWVAPMAVLAAVSAVDDFRGLPVAVRLAVQGAVAAWAVAAWLGGASPWIWPAAWFATVWMTNLYNFMDGSDGLAGGMALFGFGAYAAASWLAGDPALAAASLSIAAAAGAFLCFNFHPARVFLGDAGSIPLGFAAAALGIAGWTAGHWPAVFPVLVFAPFVADATLTLARRLARGDRVWQAHNSHYYQRLIRMGLGHRRTALLEYGLMASVGITAVAALSGGLLWPVAAAWAAVLAVLAAAVDRRWSRALAVGDRTGSPPPVR
jgi:UDP-N-acetylmuramyl pentapeptide phosphotransferase/UDP-N-acetylglucosamine-1-phosphate transferase